MFFAAFVVALALGGVRALPSERLCPVGTFSPTGLVASGHRSCQPCALGSYQPEAGQTSCIAAEAGTYINVLGALRSMPCPAGKALWDAAPAALAPSPAPHLRAATCALHRDRSPSREAGTTPLAKPFRTARTPLSPTA
ncbi:hypothetical protein HDZ31DRAFT_62270 [Schizophyllum fasciatum]